MTEQHQVSPSLGVALRQFRGQSREACWQGCHTGMACDQLYKVCAARWSSHDPDKRKLYIGVSTQITIRPDAYTGVPEKYTMSTRTIAIFNHKGGVGKTTTAVNLAAVLAQTHRKHVLIIDLDPQANATRALQSADLSESRPTVKDWLFGKVVSAPVLATPVEGLSLVPADLTLSEAAFGVGRGRDGNLLLRSAVTKLTTQYDFLLIDCPPSLGPLALNALAAADDVVVPCETQYLALRGLSHVIDLVELVKARLNPKLTILGVLATKFHILSLANNEVLKHLRANGRVPVFRTVIARDVRAEETASHGLPLLLYAPEARATLAYMAFAQEVIDLCRD